MFNDVHDKITTSDKKTVEIGQTVSDELAGLKAEIKTFRQQLDGVAMDVSEHEGTQDRAYVELIAQYNRGQKLQKELDALKKLTSEWNNRILLLNESKNGKRLAMVPSRVDIFEQLDAAPRPSP